MGSQRRAPSADKRKNVDSLGESETLAHKLCHDEPGQQSAGMSKELCDHFAWLVRRFDETSSGQPAELLTVYFANAFRQPISAHEAECLGYILCHSIFTLVDRTVIGPFSPEEAGAILGDLAGEYEEQFLLASGQSDIWSMPEAERADFWALRMEELLLNDEPLGFVTQSTVRRIRDLILSTGDILAVTFAEDCR